MAPKKAPPLVVAVPKKAPPPVVPIPKKAPPPLAIASKWLKLVCQLTGDAFAYWRAGLSNARRLVMLERKKETANLPLPSQSA